MDIILTLTESQMSQLRSAVGKASRGYASEAETWRKLQSDPELPKARRNAEVLEEEHAAMELLDQFLTEAYVKAVVHDLD